MISVIIPALNAANFLPGLLSALQSGHQCPGEIILVDDGSTDASTRIARGLPTGSDLEYADEETLAKALENRREI